MKVSGLSGERIPTTLAEINVTPMVDVMLVLLVIFMISAPMMQQGVTVNLPKASAGSLEQDESPLVLILDKGKKIYLAGNLIPPGSLLTKLSAILEAKPNTDVIIQADQSIPYGFVAEVMAEVKTAGIQRVGLATDPTVTKKRL